MQKRSKSLILTANSSGFSLMELLVVLAILGVVAAGTSAQLLSNHKSVLKLQSKANMTQTMTLMHKAFGKNMSTAARTCAETLQPVSQFSPNGVTPVEIRMGDHEAYSAGAKIPGQTEFTVSRIYLSDNFPLIQRPNSYVSTLYLEAAIGPDQQRMKPRAIATVVVTIDGAGKIASCNVSTQTPSSRETCDAMYGMTWDDAANECQQALALDENFNMTACPAGTRKVGQTCIPTATGCANGQLARGFDLGQVQSCEEPPLNPAVGIPTQSVAAPVEGVPDQTPVPVPSPGIRLPAVSSGTGAGSAPAAPSPTPSSCIDLIGAVNYAYCNANATCKAFLETNPPADANCVAQTSVAYATPAPTSTPSLAPPADLTCACNSSRIGNGEYCMYCIENVDYGYGYVDYAYGVSRCTDGNLVPDPGASASVQYPPPLCSGGYAPVRMSGEGFRQFDGYDIREN